VEPLIKALETDKSTIVRAAAARVLGRLRDARARPALEKASHDQDASLALAARDALRELP
jgi:HEAT repeat protein